MIGVAVIVMIFGCKFIIVCGRECCFALKVRDFWVVQCFPNVDVFICKW